MDPVKRYIDACREIATRVPAVRELEQAPNPMVPATCVKLDRDDDRRLKNLWDSMTDDQKIETFKVYAELDDSDPDRIEWGTKCLAHQHSIDLVEILMARKPASV